MGRLGEPATKLIDEARLAESRLADDLNELPGAGLCAPPAPDEEIEIVFATDKPRLHPRASAPAAAARAHDSVQNRRTRNAFEFAWAFVFDDEQARDLSLHGGSDEHRSGLGGALRPSGEVWSVAEHLARGIHNHRPAIEPDAGGERG
jgi:hypothetical protein